MRVIPITLFLFVVFVGAQASATVLARQATSGIYKARSLNPLLTGVLSSLIAAIPPIPSPLITTSATSSSAAITSSRHTRLTKSSTSAISSPGTPSSSTVQTNIFTPTPTPLRSNTNSATSSPEISTLSTAPKNATTPGSSNSSMPISGPLGSEGNAKNSGAVIGGTIGAVLIALVLFVFLIWYSRKRQTLVRKKMFQGDAVNSAFNPFGVYRRLGAPNALISPYLEAISGPDESLPNTKRKMRPPAAPSTPDLAIENQGSAPLQVNLEKSRQRRPRILPSTENYGDRIEVIPAEHRPAESSLESAEHDEILNQLDPITYRYQDSGWRPTEFESNQNEIDDGREVIELPPDYSEAS